jgi:Gpi18-like mannosyltransferase
LANPILTAARHEEFVVERTRNAAALAERPDKQGLSWPTQLAAIFSIAVCFRAIYWSIRPPDMRTFLEPWFAHIVRYGPIGAFAHPFSNYEPAYLYVLAASSLLHGVLAPMTTIKLLSVLGTGFLTLALADLLKAAGADSKGALLVLLLPTIVLNDALLGQCDALWAGSCVFALAAMMRAKTLRAMVWCGVAIGFKSQAAFIAPAMIGAMIGRRAPWWQWLVPAITFLASLVPAWLVGWPLGKLLTVYAEQAAWDQVPGRLGNPWMVGTMFAEQTARELYVVGYAVAIAAAAVLVALAAAACRDRRRLLLVGLLSATALPFLLPKMHERYYFLADVLALALALALRTRGATFIAVAVQMASLLSVFTYVYWYHDPYPALVAAVFASAALFAMGQLLRDGLQRAPRPSVRPFAFGNPLVERSRVVS